MLDLNERLKDIGERLRPLIGDDVEIVIVTKSDSALVEADPAQMDDIVLNLAFNARDAMPYGGKLVLETSVVELEENSVHLRRRSMKAGKYIVLVVSDSGTGMDHETLSRCFEPYFTTKKHNLATYKPENSLGKERGLGLTAVFAIVRASGGDITVCSDPGRGTTFEMYLPSAEHKVGVAPPPLGKSSLPNSQH